MYSNGRTYFDPPSPRTKALRSTLSSYEGAGDLDALLDTLRSTPSSMRKEEITQRINDTANAAIKHAVRANDITRVCDLLSQWRAAAAEAHAQTTKSGDVPLREGALAMAVRNRSREMAEVLMRNGAVVGGEVVCAIRDEFDREDADGAALLDVLDGLVASGWDVNAELKDLRYRYAIRLAVHEPRSSSSPDSSRTTSKTAFLDWLLAHDASPNKTITSGSMVTSATYTIFVEPKDRLASLPSMRRLLAHGGAAPDANVLHKAIRLPTSHPERLPIIELQLSHGADINALEAGMSWTCNGKFPRITHATPLFEAVVAGDVGLVRMLVERGADARVRNAMEHCGKMQPGLSALEAMRGSASEEMRALADERWGKETRAQKREKRDALRRLGPRRVVKTK